jgi:uncharacterized membrane protein
MVAAHVTDAWTREADRHDTRFFITVFVNGLGAPLFLLLAGVALAMAAESRARTIGTERAGRSVLARGWQVFGLAFLFRLQAQLLGWGPLVNLLKVDILNVMGLAMVAAAGIWRIAGTRPARIAAFAASTAMFAFLTPMVRESQWIGWLPDPIEWYFRPVPNRTTFTLFPWAGFLTAGALAGQLIDAARSPAAERRLHTGLLLAGLAGIAGGYAASLLPTIYANAQFWTSSPTFFFIRLGIVIVILSGAWFAGLAWEPLVTLGRSSLFVYWIHVEMVYGAAAIPLRRLLPWESAVLATLALCAILYWLVRLKNQWMERRTLPAGLGILAPILK